MFDHIQEFHRPQDVGEAVQLVDGGRSGGRFVAGGTDLVLQADRSIRFLVDITRLGLSYIREGADGWAIGATTSMADLEKSPVIRALAGGVLAKAAAVCGSVQNRNMATLGGNLANASPAADTATPLLALDAGVVMQDANGARSVALTHFFSGPHRTALGGALLVEVVVPEPPAAPRTAWSFQKLGRTEADISLVNVVAGIGLSEERRVIWARIAVGAAAPAPFRVSKAEELLTGRTLDAGAIERAAAEVAVAVNPVSDVRASADYRREMSRVLVKRALRECAAEAGCSL
jgi:CO/xanthine dehydrogenase FAD-binding subunit